MALSSASGFGRGLSSHLLDRHEKVCYAFGLVKRVLLASVCTGSSRVLLRKDALHFASAWLVMLVCAFYSKSVSVEMATWQLSGLFCLGDRAGSLLREAPFVLLAC